MGRGSAIKEQSGGNQGAIRGGNLCESRTAVAVGVPLAHQRLAICRHARSRREAPLITPRGKQGSTLDHTARDAHATRWRG
eukprot:3764533-Prymnesium_polylepis.1